MHEVSIQAFRNLCSYPHKTRKPLKNDKVFWIYRKGEHGDKTCFGNFCEYIAEIDTIDWKFLEESFNFDSKGLAQIISRGSPNNKMWQD
jgi:hypothetical protein